MKKAVEGKTRVDLAVEQIIQVILDRDMKAGDKLPNEYDLARELGVGRSTLREAIKRLVARNILTARQGAGTFVSEKNGVPEDPLGLTFIMEEGTENLALDLQDIRLMLEPETCAIVARGATPEQIEQMQAYCDEVTRLIEAKEDYSAADAKFHRYLAECSGNHVLPNLIPIIASAIGVVITVTNDEHRSQRGMEHQRIVDAIRRHDPEGAKYSMIAHLNTSRNSMRPILGITARRSAERAPGLSHHTTNAQKFRIPNEISVRFCIITKNDALVMVLFLVACGDKKEDAGTNDSDKDSQDTITLKMHFVDPETAPFVQGGKKIAELVSEATDGRIQIEVLAGGSLGGERDTIELAMDNSLDRPT